MADPFLEVIDAEEAHRRFREALRPGPVGTERVPLAEALDRIVSEDVVSPVDVPGFDRVNLDGFAVRAEDTFGAEESEPRFLTVNEEELSPGVRPTQEVRPGTATPISTGAMLPRGADSVSMVEHSEREGARIRVVRALTPGAGIAFSGSDVVQGEVVVPRGTRLTARETGTLAALGVTEVTVYRRPRVAVFSTGNEIVPPGTPLVPGQIHDSNLRTLSDSIRELGGEPVELGVVPDEPEALRARIREGLESDAVILSGGTSKGEGDLGARIVKELARVVCHGVAVKPGKPLCLAVTEDRKPVVVLPGFPTSAAFTFHEFVAPVLLEMAGMAPRAAGTVRARLAVKVRSEKGRKDFVLVGLLPAARDDEDGPAALVAYPLGKGSGSVTSFAQADGFIALGRQEEFVPEGEEVEVRLLGRQVRPADLTVIGSHCLGLEVILAHLRRKGYSCKVIVVGSQGGFLAAAREECDVAGVHLCDDSGVYNTPFLEEKTELIPGYGRRQGVVFRDDLPEGYLSLRMVNRNRGSGTRVLIDRLLGDRRPPGYSFEARNHSAVAAAVAQGRADWGVAIESVARRYGLGFRELQEERFDFVVPASRRERPAVRAFEAALRDPAIRERLEALDLRVPSASH